MIEPTSGPKAASADAMTGSTRLEDEPDHTDLLLSQHRASVRVALVEASAAFGKSPEERRAAIELVERSLADDLAAAFVVVYRYEPSPEGARRWATLGWCHVEPGDYSRFDGVLVQNSESARRVASGEIMRADRSNWTPFDFAYVASLGARVAVVAPIAADGHLYGELRIGLRHTRDLESDEIEMLRAATTTIHRLVTSPSRLAPAPPSIGRPRTPPRMARPAADTNDSIRRVPDALRDFGNLITAIVGYAELLRARTGADEATHILSAARRAAALSSQLLTTATTASASTASTEPATTPTTPPTPKTATTATTATTPPNAPVSTPTPVPDAAESGNDPAHDRKIVVLLVEDEDIVRAFTTRALERRGFDVLVAATPAEALRFASDGRHIDVLVSDVVMPGMSGPELAERFRSLHADAGIVLTSGYPSGHVLPGGQVLAPGEASGPHDIDFLGKPFEASTLVATIRANLARRGIGNGPDR